MKNTLRKRCIYMADSKNLNISQGHDLIGTYPVHTPKGVFEEFY